MSGYMQRLGNRILGAIMVVLLGVGGVVGFNLTRPETAGDIRRQQLEKMEAERDELRQHRDALLEERDELRQEHESLRAEHADLENNYQTLRATYNRAVRRTAVTELIVEDGRIDVRIRTADGETQVIETPFNPDYEIYVDYVVIDGRLWIRRVFDQYTAPGDAVVIDPELIDVDWNDGRAHVGKATYRQLDDGRWIVTVTGDGSLGLARRDDVPEPTLSPPPEVRDHQLLE